jgi:endonuclease I
MNNKMSNNENQSVTQWEKTHPVERTECDKESGWE